MITYVTILVLILSVISLTVFAFNKYKIFSYEFLGIFCICVLVAIFGYYISIWATAADTQIFSGKVTSKRSEKISCKHSYSCNCKQVCSGSGKQRSCYESCDTCYEHSYDMEWNIYSTIGTFTINTIDRRGLKEPPRWSLVKLNDPVSDSRTYQNYIKAVPDSLFNDHYDSNISIPLYPAKIYDYYRINRVVLDKIKIPKVDLQNLNNKISDALKDVAKEKQVNIVIVITTQDQIFAEQLRIKWLNGKKNDLIVVIGTKNYPEISWVSVFGWSSNDMVNVVTREAIKEHKVIDETVVDIMIENIKQYWVRKPMADYAYLQKEIEPSNLATFVLITIGILVIFIYVWYLQKNNLKRRNK